MKMLKCDVGRWEDCSMELKTRANTAEETEVRGSGTGLGEWDGYMVVKHKLWFKSLSPLRLMLRPWRNTACSL